MGNKPNTIRRFEVYKDGRLDAEGVRLTNGVTVVYDLMSGYVEPYLTMAEARAAITGEVVYVDPDPTCIYCNGWGTDHNAQCLCYGPAARLGVGNLAHRTAQEAEHGM